LRRADLIVAPTRAMLAALNRTYGDFGHARVIFNGRDSAPPEIRSSSARIVQPALEHIPVREDAPRYLSAEKESFVLSVGRLWDEAKNAAALAAVAPKLPWPVRLAGETHGPDGVTTMILQNVELVGQRSAREIADDYRRAAIYALPARYEPFGLSVLEAALSGCALVLGDISSLRELWSGVASFVPPDNTNLLRAELIDLIGNPYRRQIMGLQAQQRAHRFSVARMTAGYLSAYDDLLATTHREAHLTATFA
jgi:glycogen synthase